MHDQFCFTVKNHRIWTHNAYYPPIESMEDFSRLMVELDYPPTTALSMATENLLINCRALCFALPEVGQISLSRNYIICCTKRMEESGYNTHNVVCVWAWLLSNVGEIEWPRKNMYSANGEILGTWEEGSPLFSTLVRFQEMGNRRVITTAFPEHPWLRMGPWAMWTNCWGRGRDVLPSKLRCDGSLRLFLVPYVEQVASPIHSSTVPPLHSSISPEFFRLISIKLSHQHRAATTSSV